MASGNDFVPNRESDLIPFLTNWSVKLPLHGVALGFTAPQVASLVADALCGIASVNQAQALKDEQQETTAFKNLILYGPIGEPTPAVPTVAAVFALSPVAAGVIKRLRDAANRARAHPTYTAVIGADLGIIAPAPAPTPPGDVKPTAKGRPQGHNEAVLDWVKAGHDAVRIESRRGGEAAFTALGSDVFPPYVDNRPLLVAGQPEERQYQLQYEDNDAAVGLWSDIVRVTVGP